MEECIAKSALKIGSKKNSKIDILNYVRITVVDGKVNKILTEVNVINSFEQMKTHEYIFASWVFAECMEKLFTSVDVDSVNFAQIMNLLLLYNKYPKYILGGFIVIIFVIFRGSGFNIEFDNYFDTHQKIIPSQKRFLAFQDNVLGFVQQKREVEIGDDLFKLIKYLFVGRKLEPPTIVKINDEYLVKVIFYICTLWVENVTDIMIKSKKLFF